VSVGEGSNEVLDKGGHVPKDHDAQYSRDGSYADQAHNGRRLSRVRATSQLVEAPRGLVRLDRCLLDEIGNDLVLGHVCERPVVVAETRHDVNFRWSSFL